MNEKLGSHSAQLAAAAPITDLRNAGPQPTTEQPALEVEMKEALHGLASIEAHLADQLQHLKPPNLPRTDGREIVDGNETEAIVGTKAETVSNVHTVEVKVESEADAEPHSPSRALSSSAAAIAGVDDDHVVQLLRAQIKSYQEQLELLKRM